MKRLMYSVLAAGTMAAVLLTGCKTSRRTVDYAIETDESADDNKAAVVEGEGIAQYKDIDKWSEKWEVTLDDNSVVTINVNAGIRLPEAEEMSVVEAEYIQFNDSFKEKILKQIYGDEQVYYYDAHRRPREKVQAAIEELNEKLESITNDLDNGYIIGEWIEPVQAQAEEYQNELKLCNESLNNPIEDYIPITDYDCSTYIGLVNGHMTVVDFIHEIRGRSGYENINRQIAVYPESLNTVAAGDFREYSWLQVSSDSECSGDGNSKNGCSLSPDEATDMAEKYIADLGIDNQELMGCYNLMWNGGEALDDENYRVDKEGLNGYVVYLGRPVDAANKIFPDDINSMHVEFDGARIDSITDNEQHTVVVIGDNGVIMADIANAYTVTGTTDNVNMITFDSVKGVIKDTIEFRKKLYSKDIYELKSIDYTSMTLQYKRVDNKVGGEGLSYIPVWYLRDMNFTLDIYINAIDGKCIEEPINEYLLE